MPPTSPSGRSNLQIAYDSGRGVTVLFGGGYGDSTSGMNNETWEWDGTTWTQKFPVLAPSPRTAFGMVYDSARGVTVLFGGFDDTTNMEIGDTWEWNGTNWTKRSPISSPSPRWALAMAYDSARGVTVLFGGYTGGFPQGDTWEWNGTNWFQRLPITSPTARLAHEMAFDSARGVTVLFGGFDVAFQNDTWEWNGINWSQRSPAAAPPPRDYPIMVFDTLRNVTVMFGGLGNAMVFGDFWEWDGTNWLPKFPPAAPAARFYHAMAYDSGRHTVVMFGGVVPVGANSVNSQETWESINPRIQISQQPGSQTVGIGQFVVFSIMAGGPQPISYQWRMNGTLLMDGAAISGAATAALSINPVAESDGGTYDCLIGSATCTPILSDSATLTVDPCRAVGTAEDANGNGVLDSCETSASPGCGTCGAGTATMMPMFLAFMAARRRKSRQRPPD